MAVLSYVMSSADATDEQVAAAEAVRSSYLSFVATASAAVTSEASYESASVAVQALTNTNPGSISTTQQWDVLSSGSWGV